MPQAIRVILRFLWWASLVWLWGAFWLFDLRFAKAADLLWLVPLTAAVTPALGCRCRDGAVFALCLLWLYFWDRASIVGCLGVSQVYEDMLVGTPMLFLIRALAAFIGVLKASAASATRSIER